MQVHTKVNGDARLFTDTQLVSAAQVKERAHHVKNESREEIPFSGPLIVSSSSGFAWAKKPEGRSFTRSIALLQVTFPAIKPALTSPARIYRCETASSHDFWCSTQNAAKVAMDGPDHPLDLGQESRRVDPGASRTHQGDGKGRDGGSSVGGR